MTDFNRMKAQRRVELDESLLRHIQLEEAGLRNRLTRLQGEVDGAQKMIAEKERQIHEAQALMAEITEKLDALLFEKSELSREHDRWREHLAG